MRRLCVPLVALLAVLAAGAVAEAATGPGTTPASGDLSWVTDAALAPDAANARAEAARLSAEAEAAEKNRATLAAERKALADEQAQLIAALPGLKHSKKKQAEQRLQEIPPRIRSLDGSIAERQGVVARDRAAAARDVALAAALDRERAQRAREAADAISPDDDLAQLSDARLLKGRAWLTLRLSRIPKQIAAIDRDMDRLSTPTARAQLLAAADAVRAEKAADEALIARIDQERNYRSETKADEARAADDMARAAAAKASADAADKKALATLEVTSARSAALDRDLDAILAAQDAAAAKVERRRSITWTSMRYGLLVLVLAGSGAALFLTLRRR